MKRTILWAACGLAMQLMLQPLSVPGAIAASSSTGSDSKPGADGLRASYQACLDASGGADAAIQDCIGEEYEFQDARLNATYKALMAKLSPGEQAQLKADERKWLVHRNAHCKLDPGGQGQRLGSNDCVVEENAKRATVLEGRLH